LLQVLSVTLFEKLPLDQALTRDAAKGVTSQITNQLHCRPVKQAVSADKGMILNAVLAN